MQSAFYDDMLRIETFVMLMPTSRFRLDYKIFNQHNEQLAEGYTVLAFFDAINRRPVRMPAVIGDVLKPFL
jgi:acyl-CoA thioesterase FadM